MLVNRETPHHATKLPRPPNDLLKRYTHSKPRKTPHSTEAQLRMHLGRHKTRDRGADGRSPLRVIPPRDNTAAIYKQILIRRITFSSNQETILKQLQLAIFYLC